LATQVCDRWHILKNLGEAVEGFLIRTRIRLPDAKTAEPTPERPLTSYSATPVGQGKSQARLLRKWRLYQHVQELHAQGMSLRAIADQLDLARNTVRKYFRQPPEPPLPTPRPLRVSQLDRYEDYILERWGQGCRNAAQIHREISALGYQGAQTNVRAYVAHVRTSTADGSAPRSRKQRVQAVSPRTLRWLLTRDKKDLKKARTSPVGSALATLP
jgi:transposase